MKKSKKEKGLSKTNPNGVNQFTPPDPRQTLFLTAYTNPDSPTFANAYQSALVAKYSKEYAEVLVGQMPDWLSENLKKMCNERDIADARRRLSKQVNENYEIDVLGIGGMPVINKKTKKPVKKIDTGIMRNSLDASKFVLEKLDKDNFGRENPGAKVTFKFNVKSVKEKYAS